jgi:hypothetical protein
VVVSGEGKVHDHRSEEEVREVLDGEMSPA